MNSILAALAVASTGFVDRGAYEIHYERMGKGTPMVAIAGGPGFAGRAVWSIGWEFQDVKETILFDQLGTGLSRMKDGSRPKLSLAKTVADLDALRAHLGFKKWTVFGQSWGAMVAVAYALEYPHRVDKMVLASIPAFRSEDTAVLGSNLKNRISLQAQDALAAEMAKAKSPAEQAAIRVFGLTPYYFEDVEQGKALAARAPASLFDGQTFLDLYPEISHRTFESLKSRAKRWKGEALLVQGHQDPCGAAMPYRLAEWLPNCEVRMINGAGHFSFIEMPEFFADEVRPFLGVPSAPHYREPISKAAQDWYAKSKAAGWPFGYPPRP